MAPKKKTQSGEDWVITPKQCKEWNYKQFGHENFGEVGKKIGHKNNGGLGILPYAVKALVDLAKNDGNPIDAIIVSTGMVDALGVDTSTRDYLKKLKPDGAIKAYKVCNSKEVMKQHNDWVVQGYKVGTLLHSTC